MALHSQYTSEILEQLNYNATWLPTVQLKPGDVCDLSGDEIQLVSHLDEFKIAFEMEDRPVATDIEYTSAGAVSMRVKLKGDPVPGGSVFAVGDAGISFSFGRSEAVVLRMGKCTSKRLKSLQQVGTQVLAQHNAGTWPEGYVVVTEIVSAGASTIIISNGSNAGIDLTANASVGEGPLTLASLDAKFQVKRESMIGMKLLAEAGLTPLVRVSGIQKRFLRPDRFKSAGAPLPGNAFGPVDYADYTA